MMRYLLPLAAALLALPGCAQDDAASYLNQGVEAYLKAQYPAAAALFRKAVELDPNSKTAHLYLATAYAARHIPGGESAENLQLADQALAEFGKALELDPKDEAATGFIAQIYFEQKKMA